MLRKQLGNDPFLDVHLMVSSPEQWLQPMQQAGASQFTFHYEALEGLTAVTSLIQKVKASGLNGRPTRQCAHYDGGPGFGGQKFMSDQMTKVKKLRQAHPTLNIQVDGGVSQENVDECAEAGANLIVSGTGIIKSKDIAATIAQLRKRVQKAYEKLEVEQRKENLPVQKLIQDVETRWNSTHDMSRRLCQQRRAIEVFCLRYKRELCLEEKEWSQLQELVEILNPFEEATKQLCLDSSTLSEQWPVGKLLDVKLEQGSNFSDVRKRMREMIAAKFLQLGNETGLSDGHEVSVLGIETEAEPPPKVSKPCFFSFGFHAQPTVAHPHTSVNIEIDAYVKDRCAEPDEDILAWWRLHHSFLQQIESSSDTVNALIEAEGLKFFKLPGDMCFY
uniref:Ribulose-phosphate 3-epimerase n=1 Tax=Ditylenchus dipsaci TaxID=166011 RepID=A0A915E4Y3_9BILA